MGLWYDLTRAQRWMLVLGLIGLGLAQVDQAYLHLTILHHTPTLLFLLALPWFARRYRLSDSSIFCLFLFMTLHTIGGRYTYVNTPYDAWFEVVFGQGLNSMMGWERNHFDRLVHFAFGALMVAPVAEFLRTHASVSHLLAIYIGVEFVMGVSALYEIFEWLLSIFLAARDVEAYNGQQGDIWDPQKDMALAFLGAIATAAVLLIRGLVSTTSKERG